MLARAEPFDIAVPEDALEDLRSRLRATRWPPPAPDAPWRQGTDLEDLQNLVACWAGGFDWRAQERCLNDFAHHRVELDGLVIHLVHERALDGAGIPLILSHGSPRTFLQYLPLVPLLTDPTAHGIAGPSFWIVGKWRASTDSAGVPEARITRDELLTKRGVPRPRCSERSAS